MGLERRCRAWIHHRSIHCSIHCSRSLSSLTKQAIMWSYKLSLLLAACTARLGAGLPVSSQDIELRQLTDDTFRSETARGLW